MYEIQQDCLQLLMESFFTETNYTILLIKKKIQTYRILTIVLATQIAKNLKMNSSGPHKWI